jgi:hypothetical protein
MKAKMLIAAVLSSLVCGVAVRAQPPAPVSGAPRSPAYTTGAREDDESPRNVIAEPPPAVSEYVMGRKNVCCNTPNIDPVIGEELYFRSGVSFPFGRGRLTDNSSLGYILQIGGHTIFYHPSYRKAWYVDGGLSFQHNSGVEPGDRDTFLLDVVLPNQFGQDTRFPAVPVTVRSSDRTFLNLGLGHEWYLWGRADQCTTNLRFCMDGGGRYGFMTMGLNEIRHRTDVIGGTYVGAETILEIPCEQSKLRLGVRSEWAYTWSDILQRETDLQEINVLFTIGVRY